MFRLVLNYLSLEELTELYYVNSHLRYQVSVYLDRKISIYRYTSSDIVLTLLLKRIKVSYVDWSIISLTQHLSPDIIDKHQFDVNWLYLQYNDSWTVDFFDRHQSDMNWQHLNLVMPVTIAVIDRYYQRWSWTLLSENPSLTPEVIDRYQDKWDWYRLSSNSGLSPEVIDRYQSRLNWDLLSLHANITISVIDQHLSKWNWHHLSSNKHLTSAIILRYLSRWDWEVLNQNPSLTYETIKECIVPESKWYYRHLLENQRMTSGILTLTWDKVQLYYDDPDHHWSLASRNVKVTIEAIHKYWDWWNLDELSANPSLTAAIVDAASDEKWNWNILAKNDCFTHEVIARYKEVWYGPETKEIRVIKKYHKYWNWCKLTTALMKKDSSVFLDHPDFPWILKRQRK